MPSRNAVGHDRRRRRVHRRLDRSAARRRDARRGAPSGLRARRRGGRSIRGPAVTLAELPAWAFELLEESRIAHLGLVDDDGYARVLPVTYAVHDGALWTVVDEKPKRREGAELARVRWLRARPRAA